MKYLPVFAFLVSCGGPPCTDLGLCSYSMDLLDIEASENGVLSQFGSRLKTALLENGPVPVTIEEPNYNHFPFPGIMGVTEYVGNNFAIYIVDIKWVDRCQRCETLAHELMHVVLISEGNETVYHPAPYFDNAVEEDGASVEEKCELHIHEAKACGCAVN